MKNCSFRYLAINYPKQPTDERTIIFRKKQIITVPTHEGMNNTKTDCRFFGKPTRIADTGHYWNETMPFMMVRSYFLYSLTYHTTNLGSIRFCVPLSSHSPVRHHFLNNHAYHKPKKNKRIAL